jgi:hypothetical protein
MITGMELHDDRLFNVLEPQPWMMHAGTPFDSLLLFVYGKTASTKRIGSPVGWKACLQAALLHERRRDRSPLNAF